MNIPQAIKMNGQYVPLYKLGQSVTIAEHITFEYNDKNQRLMWRCRLPYPLPVKIIGIQERCSGEVVHDPGCSGYFDVAEGPTTTFSVTRRWRLWQVRATLTSPILEVLPEQIVDTNV